MRINTEKITNEESLQDIKNEQLTIKSIGTQITNNADIGTLINNYLPDKKSEERIIGGINYLANDSAVSLVNFSLQDLTEKAPAMVPTSDIVEGQAPLNNVEKVQFIEATISISGDYDKIKLFINQLQKISLFNNIKSLTISKEDKKTAADLNGIEVILNPSTLSARIVIDFGYLPFSEINSNSLANFKPEFDENSVNVLKQYISQKTESADYLTSGNAEKGRQNPFIP